MPEDQKKDKPPIPDHVADSYEFIPNEWVEKGSNEANVCNKATIFPGQPRLSMTRASDPAISDFLQQEFCSEDLDKMSPRLWMMSMQSSGNISPLHRQHVKQRQICITEDPKLHLVWFHDRIFIKPLPRYLLSRNFWKIYLLRNDSPLGPRRDAVLAAALGYLRTWLYLVKHESDFRIAQDKALFLVPEGMSWETFCRITADLKSITDLEVSERYQYGEIRLTRLNFYSRFFLGKGSYQRMHSQYSDYFAQYYGPLLFVFGILSVILNCMQVVMSAEQIDTLHWKQFWSTARWFGVVCSATMSALVCILCSVFLFKFCSEWRKALGDRGRKRTERDPFLRQPKYGC